MKYLNFLFINDDIIMDDENLVIIIFGCILVILMMISIILYRRFGVNPNGLNIGYKLKFTSKQMKKINHVSYSRNIPCDGNIISIYWISRVFNLCTSDTNLVGAILLKWLKNGNIKYNENKSLSLLNDNDMCDVEKELFHMIRDAAGSCLEKKEFLNWCKINNLKILNWFEKTIFSETLYYFSKELLKKEKKKSIFNNNYILDDKIYDDVRRVMELRKFLINFKKLNDGSAKEIENIDEYLIYSQIFGISTNFTNDLNKIYPNGIDSVECKYDYEVYKFIDEATNYIEKLAINNYRKDVNSLISSVDY